MVVFISTMIWLIICQHLKVKFKIKGARRNPFVIGTMPYMFFSMMIYGAFVTNDFQLLYIVIGGLIVSVIASIFSIKKVKEIYSFSKRIDEWYVCLPGIVFMIYMALFIIVFIFPI